MRNGTPLYFSSTKSAVDIISNLLRDHNWPQLARYYDLTGTDLKYADLTSGQYFMGDHSDHPRHPGLSRGNRPFAPGFQYDGEYSPEENITVVRLKISIDQGEGMTQTGYDSFALRKSSAGYQVIPEKYSPFPDLP